mgnify:CR=1 FL=1
MHLDLPETPVDIADHDGVHPYRGALDVVPLEGRDAAAGGRTLATRGPALHRRRSERVDGMACDGDSGGNELIAVDGNVVPHPDCAAADAGQIDAVARLE